MSGSDSPDTLLENTIDGFWDAIPPVWRRIRDHVRRIAMEQFHLTIEQFHILRLIRRGYASVSDLADAQLISRSAASQAVETLVLKGLVSRDQQAEDRRYVRLGLTAEGSALLDAVFAKNRVWMRELMNHYSPEELSALQKGMDILKKIEKF